MRKRSRRSGFTLIELMIVIAIIAILAAILVPSYVRARAMSQLTGCKSNLKNLATALEAYSVDAEAHYPATLSLLTPNYLKALPQCPSVSSMTYNYTVTVLPDAFTLMCEGSAHEPLGLQADYPQWDSGRGLIERMP